MNLIDRDELINERNLAIKAYENANVLTANAIREYLKPLLDKIVDLPTVNMEEVKYGTWIEDGYYGSPCVCSNCGTPVEYCPHCNAKMDGGKTDND